MNMPFSLKESIHIHGFCNGITVYQNYRRFLFLARLRNLRQRVAYWVFPELHELCQKKVPPVVCTKNNESTTLQELQNENTRLRSQLKYLEAKYQNCLWPSKLNHIFTCSDEQLQTKNQWIVQQTEDDGWEIVTGICSVGGCDLYVYPVYTEREGLLFGALLSELDYKMPRNTACSSCYAEHIKDCI